LLDHPNNYVERSSVNDNAAKNFNILAIGLSVLHNYFDDSNKIIFRFVATFLDISTKFFPCTKVIEDFFAIDNSDGIFVTKI